MRCTRPTATLGGKGWPQDHPTAYVKAAWLSDPARSALPITREFPPERPPPPTHPSQLGGNSKNAKWQECSTGPKTRCPVFILMPHERLHPYMCICDALRLPGSDSESCPLINPQAKQTAAKQTERSVCLVLANGRCQGGGRCGKEAGNKHCLPRIGETFATATCLQGPLLPQGRRPRRSSAQIQRQCAS